MMYRRILQKSITSAEITSHLSRKRTEVVTRSSGAVVRLINTTSKSSQESAVVKKVDGAVTTSTATAGIGFAKNICLGKINKSDVFPYPEISYEDFTELNQLCEPIEKFFDEKVDSKQIDINAKIDEATLQGLKDLGLFGQQIPEEYGGLDLNNTKYARIAEITAQDGAIGVTLAAHQAIGLKGILIAGNEAQKKKYLPRLASGELVAAFCLTEPSSGSDAASIQTRATLSPDGKHFLLNGGKIWISNGGIADVFTVFARTEVTNDKGEKQDKITGFIVERAFGGITSGKPEDKLGIRGSNTCEVHFDNTPVPVENVLGEVGSGFKLAMNILNSGRFSMGSSGSGMIRKMVAQVTEHATSRKQFNTKLKDFGLIQEKIAQMTVTAYAMESMAYLTAGMLDRPGEKDCSVEAAMVKIFSSEGCWYSVSEALQILGGLGYMKDYPYERYMRDCRILLIFEGTNEILRMYVALTCLQHAGKELQETLKKLRAPLSNPGFVYKAMSKRLLYKMGLSPKVPVFHEDDATHPTLKESAEKLARSITVFGFSVESILAKYKKDIVREQMVLKRVADVLIDIYAMTAVLSRASRSISWGLPNNDHEALLATTFCDQASKRIEQKLTEIAEGDANGDESLKRIATEVCDNRGFKAVHALTKEF